MKTEEEIQEIIEDNLGHYPLLTSLSEVRYVLPGGAVVDIYNKEQPKDSDFVNTKNLREFLDNSPDSRYEYETENSRTYIFKGERVQLIGESTRPFRIHSGEIHNNEMTTGDFRIMIKNICTISYNHKRLIPNKRTQVDEGLFVCLNKWIQKGYYINEVDYQNALNTMVRSLSGKRARTNYT